MAKIDKNLEGLEEKQKNELKKVTGGTSETKALTVVPDKPCEVISGVVSNDEKKEPVIGQALTDPTKEKRISESEVKNLKDSLNEGKI